MLKCNEMKKVCLLVFLMVVISHSLLAQDNRSHNPVTIFEELWSQFDQQYAGFELRNVDWNQLHEKYSAKISEQTTKEALFETCCEMLRELNDAHVSLIDESGPVKKRCNANNFPDSTTIFKRFTEKKFYQMVDRTLMSKGFSPLLKSQVISYANSGNIGYIRIAGMSKNSKGLNSALDALKHTNGLIIDIRLNPGGTDQYLYQIAGRFADQRRVGHYLKTRIKGLDRFTEVEAMYLKPSGKYQYKQPIIILTSDFTASAAEVFTLAMKQLPNVTIMGDRTNGAMSHMLPIRLSNGWRVSLSNQITYSADMRNYEGVGIPPDIKIKDDPKGFEDRVLLSAIEELTSRR